MNAQHHISVKLGESVSIRTVNRILHQNHLTLLRPRTMPAKGNEIQQQTFFDDLRNQIQQASPNEQFFFFDAASVHRSTSVTRVWAEKGHQPEIKCCGGRERVHILGFLNFTSSQARFQFSDTLGAKELISLIRSLFTDYPGKILHIILDNARAHHAKLVQLFEIQNQDRLQLHYLPAYSPKLNPIEKFWKFLREQVTHNTYFEDFDKFKLTIIEFLQSFKETNEKISDLCKIYHQTGSVSVAGL